jgi:hypothetical protein
MRASDFFETLVISEPGDALATPDMVAVHGDAPADIVDGAIVWCSAFAEAYTGRRFGVARYQFNARFDMAFREGHLVTGRADALPLPAFPVGAVNNVKEIVEGGTEVTLLPGVDYALDAPNGRLARLGAEGASVDWWPPRGLRIDAWAGYVLPGQDASKFPGSPELPKEVSRAVALMAALWVARFPKGYKPVDGQPDPQPELTSEAMTILNAYRI